MKKLLLLLSVCLLALPACKTSKLSKGKEKRSSSSMAALVSERDSLLKELEKYSTHTRDSFNSAVLKSLKGVFPGLNEKEVQLAMRDGKVYISLSNTLLFRSGSASLEQNGQAALKKLALVLERNPQIEIMVEGHTDNIPISGGQYKDNWELSTARALTIVKILCRDYKIAPARLTAAGRGEYQPITSNATAEGRMKNRRTEIILTPKMDELYKIANTY